MTETNPHLRKLDQIQAAQKQFNEVEWRLTFLRTITSEPIPKPTGDELCKLFTLTRPALDWN